MINKKRIIKIVLLMGLVSLTSLFSVSCSSLFDSASKFKPYNLRGSWRNIDNYNEKFTISYDGILTFYNKDGSSSTHYIQNWENDKYDEKRYYELVIPNLPVIVSIIFYFKSETECEISYGADSSKIYYYEKYN
ncbi:hypothetical protein [Brachyspira pulli]|uniref:hypothetical protein n=1 Tax=Brachyspira pulli TaxID=310721 RepID=UPI00300616C5